MPASLSQFGRGLVSETAFDVIVVGAGVNGCGIKYWRPNPTPASRNPAY